MLNYDFSTIFDLSSGVELVIAKFHYTGPTGPDRTRTGVLQPGSPRNSVGSVRVSDKVHAGPCGSARVRSGPCSGI